MQTKDEILEQIKASLAELFELDPAQITLAARFNEDLEIDSIDAVDLIVQLRPLVGRRLQPEAFKSVRTVQDVVDALHGLVNDPTPA